MQDAFANLQRRRSDIEIPVAYLQRSVVNESISIMDPVSPGLPKSASPLPICKRHLQIPRSWTVLKKVSSPSHDWSLTVI